MTTPISRLKEAVKPLYDCIDPAHRFDHIERMLSFCNEGGESLGADMELLRIATLLHGVRAFLRDEREIWTLRIACVRSRTHGKRN